MVPVVQQLLCVVWLPVDSGQSEAALETTRQQLIRELIATEETYCRDLDVILDVSTGYSSTCTVDFHYTCTLYTYWYMYVYGACEDGCEYWLATCRCSTSP